MGVIDISRPVHLIINPRSGYGSSRHLLGQVRTAARRAGLRLVEYTTQAPEDATRYARGIVDQAAAAMVWGGDGTVNEVANGLAGTSLPIVPCRAGTESLLARELGVPSGPAKIVEMLQTGKMASFDLGQVNGKSFLLVVGVGFDGEVVQRLDAVRTGHISHLSYAVPIWRTFWEHDFPRMRIVADGRKVCNVRGLVFVGNIARYAAGLRICRDARFDDGLLDLVVFACRQQLSLLCHAARTMIQSHPSHRTVIYRRFRHLTVEADGPVLSQVDGDVGPQTPLEISVAPGGVKLIVPGNYDGRHRWHRWRSWRRAGAPAS